MFRNRSQAGRKLGLKIKQKYPEIRHGIVLALPRGGVVVGAELSKILEMPLDIIVTRKIGAPFNKEYAVAAVSENEIVINPRENVDKSYLEQEAIKERKEISRRIKEYRGDRPVLNLKNKTVFLVDDGLATGQTMEVSVLEAKRQNPKKIIIAVAVAPPETIKKLESKVDEIIVLDSEPNFFAVGQFYEIFDQVNDDEVKKLLKEF